MTIGERIETLRKEKSMSQAELADALDLHQTTISAIERGINLPSVPVLQRLQDFFGVALLDVSNHHEPERTPA